MTEISGLLDLRQISGNHASTAELGRLAEIWSSFSLCAPQGPRQEVCLFVPGNEFSFAVFELLLAWTQKGYKCTRLKLAVKGKSSLFACSSRPLTWTTRSLTNRKVYVSISSHRRKMYLLIQNLCSFENEDLTRWTLGQGPNRRVQQHCVSDAALWKCSVVLIISVLCE